MTKVGFALLGALVLACLSCGGGGGHGNNTPDGPLPKPLVKGITTDFVLLNPGETFSLELVVESEAGVPHPNYEFNWVTNLTEGDGEMVTDTPADGREKITFTPAVEGIFTISATVQGFVMPDESALDKRVETPVVTLLVRGGPCDRILPDLNAISLAKGEARPVTFEALHNLPTAQQEGDVKFSASHEPVTLESENPSVATVEGLVVTAVAEGKTNVVAKCGDKSFSLPVEVKDIESFQTFADGLYPVVTRASRGLKAQSTSDPEDPDNADSRLVFAPDQTPVAVIQPYPGNPEFGTAKTQRLLVAQWTGTGFGTTALGEFWETLVNPHLGMDGNGQLWVTYAQRTFPAVFVADRKADQPAGQFRIRQLPSGPDVSGPSARQHVDSQTEGLDVSSPLAITTDKKGGAYVAYVVFSTLGPKSTRIECHRAVRLATVTPDSITAVDLLEETWLVPDSGPLSCRDGLPEKMVSRIRLLPPDFSSDKARVTVLAGQNSNRKVHYINWNGTNWNSVVAIDPMVLDPENPSRVVPVDITIPGSGKTTAYPGVWVSNWNTQKKEAWFWPMNLPRTERWTSFFPHVKDGGLNLYSFEVTGGFYLGNTNASFLVFMDESGTLNFEEPTFSWMTDDNNDPEELRSRPISGFISMPGDKDFTTPDRAAFLLHSTTQVDYAVHTFPIKLKEKDSKDSTGWMVGTPQANPSLVSGPSILSDGTRYIQVQLPASGPDGVPVSALWRSDGTDFPFEWATSDAEIEFFAQAPVEFEDSLYTVSSKDETMSVLKSKDEAKTFIELGSAPCNGKVVASKILPQGKVVAVCVPQVEGDERPYQTLFMTKLVSGVQINDIGGPPDQLMGPNADSRPSIGILGFDTGFTVLVPVHGPGAGWAVQARTYDLDGKLLTENVATSKGPILPNTAVRLDNGTIVAAGVSAENGKYSRVITRTTDDFANHKVTYMEWPATEVPPMPLQVDSATGDILFIDSAPAGFDAVRIVVRRSTDEGQTWSDQAQELRPEGGYYQEPLSMAWEGNTWLFFFLDNSSSRAWLDTDDFDDLFTGTMSNHVLVPEPRLGYMSVEF